MRRPERRTRSWNDYTSDASRMGAEARRPPGAVRRRQDQSGLVRRVRIARPARRLPGPGTYRRRRPFPDRRSRRRTPTTIQIAELVAKVVRELGQPALAVAFTEHGLRRERGPRPAPATADVPQAPGRAAGAPLDEVLSDCARRWTLQTVFARDLAAAHADGLLTLTGLEVPGELAGCVLGPPGEEGLLAAVEKARRFAGDFLVLDGPEHLPSSRKTKDASPSSRAT